MKHERIFFLIFEQCPAGDFGLLRRHVSMTVMSSFPLLNRIRSIGSRNKCVSLAIDDFPKHDV